MMNVTRPTSLLKFFYETQLGQYNAVFIQDTFTQGKLTFLLHCITFCYCEMDLPHVNGISQWAIFLAQELHSWSNRQAQNSQGMGGGCNGSSNRIMLTRDVLLFCGFLVLN